MLFPEYIAVSKFSPKEIIERVKEVTDLNKNNWDKYYEGYSKQYSGFLENDYSFRISRVPTQINSFLPIIKGKIISGSEATIVELKMSPGPPGIFLLAVTAIGVLIAICGLIVGFNFRFYFIAFVPLLVMIAFDILGMMLLKFESKKDLQFFLKLLEAALIMPNH